jgi:uncharacterized oligopeptide transporter (OPT) family protein
MRTIKTIGIVIGIYAAALIAELIVGSSSPDSGGGVSVIVILGLLAFRQQKLAIDGLTASLPQYLFTESFSYSASHTA